MTQHTASAASPAESAELGATARSTSVHKKKTSARNQRRRRRVGTVEVCQRSGAPGQHAVRRCGRHDERETTGSKRVTRTERSRRYSPLILRRARGRDAAFRCRGVPIGGASFEPGPSDHSPRTSAPFFGRSMSTDRQRGPKRSLDRKSLPEVAWIRAPAAELSRSIDARTQTEREGRSTGSGMPSILLNRCTSRELLRIARG
jgi:hypothetical protein